MIWIQFEIQQHFDRKNDTRMHIHREKIQPYYEPLKKAKNNINALTEQIFVISAIFDPTQNKITRLLQVEVAVGFESNM